MRVVKKPEERRAEMVSAASKLFAQQGFVRTSVAEIVSAVDVAKGLFYYYFTTKDEMVKAVVEGYCSYLGALAQQAADGEGNAAEKIDRLLSLEAWEKCFTEPLLADLCLPQHAALYSDMCDRLYNHMKPALEAIIVPAICGRGEDERHARQMVGMGLYGMLMMARRGEISMQDARHMVIHLAGIGSRAA